MTLSRRLLLALGAGALGGLLLPLQGVAQNTLAAPAVWLANSYRAGIPLQEYWVSEKYDGVRGFWDGRTLRTRGGETINAPAWFRCVSI